MKVQRFDMTELKAVRTDDGYIKDTPIITRTGVFPYRNADGSTRYELRLPEDVFAQDSLDTLAGIPITNGHHGAINRANVKQHAIGTVLGNARQDGDNLVAQIVIHDTAAVDAGNKELSCGYECEIEMKSGVWQGQRYDCIQRGINYNHLAIVAKGRAGNARLNMDAADFQAAFSDQNPKENKIMKKIRLDNGIEYDCAAEVAVAFEKLKQDNAQAIADRDKVHAERDTAQADLQKLQNELPEKINQAVAAAQERQHLENVAKENGIDVKQDMADVEIRKAVVKKMRGDSFDLTDKSDDYIKAAFDLALADKKQVKQDAAEQRKTITQPENIRQDESPNPQSKSASQAHADMIVRLTGQGK